MTSDMKLQAAYSTIDDLRSLKVQQGREIARLEREVARLKQMLKDMEQAKKPVDAVSRTEIGDPVAARERADEFLASVRALQAEGGGEPID